MSCLCFFMCSLKSGRGSDSSIVVWLKYRIVMIADRCFDWNLYEMRSMYSKLYDHDWLFFRGGGGWFWSDSLPFRPMYALISMSKFMSLEMHRVRHCHLQSKDIYGLFYLGVTRGIKVSQTLFLHAMENSSVFTNNSSHEDVPCWSDR